MKKEQGFGELFWALKVGLKERYLEERRRRRRGRRRKRRRKKGGGGRIEDSK